MCPSVAVERQGIVTLTQSRRHSDEVTAPNKLSKTTFCPSAKQNARASREARNCLKKSKLLLCKPESRHVNRRQDLALLKKKKKKKYRCSSVDRFLALSGIKTDWILVKTLTLAGACRKIGEKKRWGDDVPLHYTIVQ